MIKTSIKGIQQVQNELAKELKKYKEAPFCRCWYTR